MKVRVTFEVSDEDRAAVAFTNRKLGKATHKAMKIYLVDATREKLVETLIEYWEYFTPQPEYPDMLGEIAIIKDGEI